MIVSNDDIDSDEQLHHWQLRRTKEDDKTMILNEYNYVADEKEDIKYMK